MTEFQLIQLLLWKKTYSKVDPEDEVTIKHVAETIKKSVGFEGPLVWDANFADGQYKKTADNSKLKKQLKGFRFTPFEQGVQESVDWFVEKFNSGLYQ